MDRWDNGATMTNSEEEPMRRFHFNRVEDASGISGTGRVAEGVLFGNGLVALTWNSVHKCVNIYTSLAEMMAVHGHEGKTVLVWVDGDPNEVEPEPAPEPAPVPKKKKVTPKKATPKKSAKAPK
jgi:hypothetical protein